MTFRSIALAAAAGLLPTLTLSGTAYAGGGDTLGRFRQIVTIS